MTLTNRNNRWVWNSIDDITVKFEVNHCLSLFNIRLVIQKIGIFLKTDRTWDLNLNPQDLNPLNLDPLNLNPYYQLYMYIGTVVQNRFEIISFVMSILSDWCEVLAGTCDFN